MNVQMIPTPTPSWCIITNGYMSRIIEESKINCHRAPGVNNMYSQSAVIKQVYQDDIQQLEISNFVSLSLSLVHEVILKFCNAYQHPLFSTPVT